MNEITQCGASEPFALRVIGDDLAPEFIDGNIVVIDPGGVVKDGCYVVVQLEEEFILRQLRVDDGKYHIYCNQPGSDQDIALSNITGVVSQRAGRRRRESKRYDD